MRERAGVPRAGAIEHLASQFVTVEFEGDCELEDDRQAGENW